MPSSRITTPGEYRAWAIERERRRRQKQNRRAAIRALSGQMLSARALRAIAERHALDGNQQVAQAIVELIRTRRMLAHRATMTGPIRRAAAIVRENAAAGVGRVILTELEHAADKATYTYMVDLYVALKRAVELAAHRGRPKKRRRPAAPDRYAGLMGTVRAYLSTLDRPLPEVSAEALATAVDGLRRELALLQRGKGA